MRKIVVIGGGLAGLISSIQLVRAGIACTVIEKKSYPFHRVCGEYISNEALPFLKSAGLFPKDVKLPRINLFEFSDFDGRRCRIPLDLGGIGISRYLFDHFLYSAARKEGVRFQLNTEVSALAFREERFEFETQFGKDMADLVIGCFGKRSRIDAQQNRAFIRKRSPYVGVKYHTRADHPDELISIHNFSGGYCGVCNVEDGLTNLCYLVHRNQLRKYGDLHEMEREVLKSNPILRDLFDRSSFVFQRPEVINEISFETKAPVENHILMAGDAAGMIAPVCGNGMAIAIRSGKMVADLVKEYCAGKMDRKMLERRHAQEWNHEFKTRLLFGRYVQRLFGNRRFSRLALNVALLSRPVATALIRRSHGKVF